MIGRKVMKESLVRSSFLGLTLMVIVCLNAACLDQPKNADATSPSILGFDFQPKQVNLGDQDQQISLQARLADSNGEIISFEAIFNSPSRNQSIRADMNSTSRISGTATDGNYTITIDLPSASENGTWNLQQLTACDADGNCKRLDNSASATLAFPTKLTVLRESLRIKNSPNNLGCLNSSEKINSFGAINSSDDALNTAKGLGRQIPDPTELGGWSNTEKAYSAQKKIIINSVFSHPTICWPA